MFPLQKSVKPAVIFLKMSTRPLPMIGVLLASDLLALAGAGVISVYLRLAMNGQYAPSLYWQLWPVLGLFLLAYAAAGLYPGVGISPVDELRRICPLYYLYLPGIRSGYLSLSGGRNLLSGSLLDGLAIRH